MEDEIVGIARKLAESVTDIADSTENLGLIEGYLRELAEEVNTATGQLDDLRQELRRGLITLAACHLMGPCASSPEGAMKMAVQVRDAIEKKAVKP